jgi:adenylate kinase family enzyme
MKIVGAARIREGNSGGTIGSAVVIPQFSIGDILRAAVSAGTSMGEKSQGGDGTR